MFARKRALRIPLLHIIRVLPEMIAVQTEYGK
jgi:hypothetical protein